MPTELRVYDDSFKAENDLSAKQFYCMELSAADQVDVCDNAADVPIGILQNKPTAGREAQVRVLGRSRAVSDGSGTAIVVGDPLKTSSGGKVIKAATDKDWAIGRALSASTADGTVIDVLLTGGFYMGV